MIDHFERVGRKRLGDVLVDEKLIAKEQLHEAQGERQRSGSLLGQILVDSGYLSEWDLAKAVSAHYNLPYLDLTAYDAQIDDVLTEFPGELAHREHLLPFDRFGTVLCLACSEMPRLEVLRRIQEITTYTPCLYVGLGSEVKRLLKQHVPEPEKIPELKVSPGDVAAENLFIDESQKEGWEKIFDLANEEILKDSDP